MPADFERCVAQVMADPDFQPREGKTKQESAIAVCRSSMELADDGREDGKVIGLTDDEIRARVRAKLSKGGKPRGKPDVLYLTRDDLPGGWDEVLENGDAIKQIPLIELGKDFKNSGSSFSVTMADAERAVENFESRGRAPIMVTIGHYPETERQHQAAAAWIEDVFVGNDGRPWGKLRVLRETREAIDAGKYKYFSAEFYPNGTDQHGEEIGFELDGGAITNTPFFPSIRVDQARGGGPLLIALARFGAGGTMDADKNGKPKDGRGGDEKVQLTKAEHEALVKERDGLREKVSALEKGSGEHATLSKRVDAVETENKSLRLQLRAGKIRSLLLAAKADGCTVQLGDHPIDKVGDLVDADIVKSLEGGDFMGITTDAGLEKCVKGRQYPRVELGGGTSTGMPGTDPTGDPTSLQGRVAMVKRRITEAKKQYGEDFPLMLGRRRQTAWEWAKADLESEPEHRGAKFPTEDEAAKIGGEKK